MRDSTMHQLLSSLFPHLFPPKPSHRQDRDQLPGTSTYSPAPEDMRWQSVSLTVALTALRSGQLVKNGLWIVVWVWGFWGFFVLGLVFFFFTLLKS